MKTLKSFLDQVREQGQQLEKWVAAMARSERLEAAPVCVDLAISMMCRARD